MIILFKSILIIYYNYGYTLCIFILRKILSCICVVLSATYYYTYNISEKPKEVFIMNKQLSDNQLTEEYIREFQDKVDWKYISRSQTLSEEFIR